MFPGLIYSDSGFRIKHAPEDINQGPQNDRNIESDTVGHPIKPVLNLIGDHSAGFDPTVHGH